MRSWKPVLLVAVVAVLFNAISAPAPGQEKKGDEKSVTSISQQELMALLETRIKMQEHKIPIKLPLETDKETGFIVAKTNGPSVYFHNENYAGGFKTKFIICVFGLANPKATQEQVKAINAKTKSLKASVDKEGAPTLKGALNLSKGVTAAARDQFLTNCFHDIDVFYEAILLKK